MAYAEELFKYAAENRKRTETKDDPDTAQDETEKTTLIYDPKVVPTPASSVELVPKLTLTFGDEKQPGFEIEFRKFLPTLLDGKLKPFVFTGIGTEGIAAGLGASLDPFCGNIIIFDRQGGNPHRLVQVN